MIYPTSRLVLLCGGVAPIALVLGVAMPQFWFIGLALLAFILVLAAADALVGAAPGQARLALSAPGAVGVGEEFDARIALSFAGSAPASAEVAIGSDPLIRATGGERQAVSLDGGEAEAQIAIRSVRRGVARPGQLWARWRGPFGLMWKQKVQAIDDAIMVTPDIRPVRQRAIQMLHRDTAIGAIAQQQIGEGAEFDALADFRPGMDKRTIDWKQSARHTALLAKEFRTERNNNIIFALDGGRAMSEPLDGLPRIDRAVSAALLCSYVALKDGDRVGIFGFDSHPRVASKAVSGGRAFALLQRIAAQIDYSTHETNYTLALSTLAATLKRRSLVVVFTDFADTISAELMIAAIAPMLKRHLILFVVLRDEELERFAAAEPLSADDVTRAVTAAALLKQRRLVVSRLRHLGVQVLEAGHEEMGPTLVARYLDLKRRAAL